MSDSAHQGDAARLEAARLEAALDRIVRALDRAVPGNAKAPEHGVAAGGADAAPEARGSGQGPTLTGDALEPAGAGDTVPLAEIGTRLDGLIADLRDVLGEARAADAASAMDQLSGGQAPLQSPAGRPGAIVN